jgi:hypothetical protein
MEKLFKHIAPYYPYDVCIKSAYWNKTGIATSLYKDLSDQIGFVCDDSTERYDIYKNCKLILRPISDITKEIEVNGEKFIPMERLSSKLFYKESDNFDSLESCRLWIKNHLSELNSTKGYDNLIHWIFQDLIKWHFDLFGLLENGLAIEKEAVK